jgi:peptidyl-prolyl cis-trans isomerase C
MRADPAITRPAIAAAVPAVDGVTLAAPDEALSAAELRRRASIELLRQAAMAAGLLAADDPPPVGGAISEAAADAIETLLERELVLPVADDPTCRRYHAANAARYAVGEKVRLRHVLFAVTPGVDIDALRKRAEACLLDLRTRTRGEADRFAHAAAELSNCPSGAQGGDLGWLTADECAPEFAREVFGQSEVGVLPRLVRSRFGLHVVEVLAREPGSVPSFEAVQSAVRQTLERRAYATAIRQYLQQLAGQSRLDGVDLNATSTPLVQ